MAGELRASVDALDLSVWAIRVWGDAYVFRTRHLDGGLVEVWFWSGKALDWSLLGSINFADYSVRFSQLRSRVNPSHRSTAAEVDGVPNADFGLVG